MGEKPFKFTEAVFIPTVKKSTGIIEYRRDFPHDYYN